jgi:putative transposase
MELQRKEWRLNPFLLTQNPKTDTEETRGKLGQKSGEETRTMPKKGHTEEQIVAVLRQAEAGARVAEICRKLGISQATYYLWKRQYSGVGVSELRQLRQLREQNGRVKRLVAERTPAAFAELHRLGKEKASTSWERALQSLLIESLECAKPASNEAEEGFSTPQTL